MPLETTAWVIRLLRFVFTLRLIGDDGEPRLAQEPGGQEQDDSGGQTVGIEAQPTNKNDEVKHMGIGNLVNGCCKTRRSTGGASR